MAKEHIHQQEDIRKKQEDAQDQENDQMTYSAVSATGTSIFSSVFSSIDQDNLSSLFFSSTI